MVKFRAGAVMAQRCSRRRAEAGVGGGVISTPFWAWNVHFWRDSPGKRKPLKGACQLEWGKEALLVTTP